MNHSVRMFCQGQSFGDQGCGIKVSRPWPSLKGRGQPLNSFLLKRQQDVDTRDILTHA